MNMVRCLFFQIQITMLHNKCFNVFNRSLQSVWHGFLIFAKINFTNRTILICLKQLILSLEFLLFFFNAAIFNLFSSQGIHKPITKIQHTKEYNFLVICQKKGKKLIHLHLVTIVVLGCCHFFNLIS